MKEVETSECVMVVSEPDVSMMTSVLLNCREISLVQPITDLKISSVSVKDLSEPCVFHLSEHVQSLTIKNCTLPLQTLNHVLQQIDGCSRLRFLDLSFTKLSGSILRLLLDPHAGLPQLEKLHLIHTAVDKDHLRYFLSRSQSLQILDLSLNTLTGCLPWFLLNPLPELEMLYLEFTALNKNDLQHISSITQSNQSPKLRELDLSHNTLTGCFSSFLTNPHPGLSKLEQLNLRSTELNKMDFQHLSNITQSNKLPMLRVLTLSGSTLTGCLSSFLPDPHPGLPPLKNLLLSHAALNQDDINHVTYLIQTQKLPGLEELYLKGNRLSETVVGQLIEACVTHHQRELMLNLWYNNLSSDFKDKWQQRCEGTNIGFDM